MKGRATWSPSLTLVPTRGCFNACGYCAFRRVAHPDDPLADALDDTSAGSLIHQRPEAAEVLLLSSEVAPSSPHRRGWMARLVALSRLALRQGRLPHTNAGPLHQRGMAPLGRLNPSMGSCDRLHRQAPSTCLAVGIPFAIPSSRLPWIETPAEDLLSTIAEARALLPDDAHLPLPPASGPSTGSRLRSRAGPLTPGGDC